MQSWGSQREVEKVKSVGRNRFCQDCKIRLGQGSVDRRCPTCHKRHTDIHICVWHTDGDPQSQTTLCGCAITHAGVGAEVARKRVAFYEQDGTWDMRPKGFRETEGLTEPTCQPCRDVARTYHLPGLPVVNVGDNLPAIKVVDLGD